MQGQKQMPLQGTETLSSLGCVGAIAEGYLKQAFQSVYGRKEGTHF